MEPSTSGGGAPIPVVTGSPEPVDLYTRGRRGGVPAVDIALVNNMPDSAFAETERQFVSLLEAAAGPLEVRLDLYALPGLPRREATKRLVAERYRPFDELLTRRLDAAIITGTEPLAPTLMEEPYWADLEALVEWAAEATSSTVLSCLAAHAAVLLLDDVQRVLLNGKCHGVFTHEVAVDHPLVAGMTGPVPVPHSRLNDIPLESLPPSYVNLLPSDEVSWTVLARGSPAACSSSCRATRSTRRRACCASTAGMCCAMCGASGRPARRFHRDISAPRENGSWRSTRPVSRPPPSTATPPPTSPSTCCQPS